MSRDGTVLGVFCLMVVQRHINIQMVLGVNLEVSLIHHLSRLSL